MNDAPVNTDGLPAQARAVIVGGGIVGCSVAYHLADLGWKDVVLLEQGQIAGGTTWHAAGLVGQLRTSNSLTKINKYSVELYQRLQAETGLPTGWNQVGSLIVGTTEERMTQLRRTAAMAEVFGVRADLVSADEAKAHWPEIRVDDVLGAVWLPGDGKVVPEFVARALAHGAEARGVDVHEGVRVDSLETRGGRVSAVRTSLGKITAEWVILCGGMWTRQLGHAIGVNIPLYPVQHHYVVSEPVAGVSPNRPVGRDPNGLIYFRSEDDGSIMLGAFQKESIPWDIERVPDDFCFSLLPADWDRYGQPLRAGCHRIPALCEVEFPKFVNGPESFTPDNQFIMGPPTELDGLFVLAGFNSVGIASAGGAGKYAAEWLDAGHPTLDLWSVDIRRFTARQNETSYLANRVTEVLGLHYQMAWPNRELETSRGIRHTALHSRLQQQHACFGTSLCWERPNWFAPTANDARVAYSFREQNWAKHVAEEVTACRERVVACDLSTQSKFLLQGTDALPLLQRVCGNNIDVAVGRIVYTGMFNERGTFESDVTVTRVGDDRFYMVSGTAQATRDFAWLQRHARSYPGVSVEDVTERYGVLGVMGPDSRRLLQEATETDLGDPSFPYLTAQSLSICGTEVRALRLSYVGELGWELHAPWDELPGIYDLVLELGQRFGLRPAGQYALNTLRLEKAYRAWGRDLSDTDTPWEAGLAWAIDWNKDFIGKAALADMKKQVPARRLISLVVPDHIGPLWGSEPIIGEGKVVGHTTSACYSPTLDAAIAMGYVQHPDGRTRSDSELLDGRYEVLNDGRRYQAQPFLEAPFDPRGTRLRA